MINKLLDLGADLSKCTGFTICPVYQHEMKGIFEFSSHVWSSIACAEIVDAIHGGGLSVETDTATLLALARRTFYHRDDLSDSEKDYVRRLRKMKFRVTRIIYISRDYNCFDTTDSTYTDSLAHSLKRIVMIEGAKFHLMKIDKLMESTQNNLERRKRRDLVKEFIAEDIAWSWSDEGTRRPQKYVDRREPLEDVSRQSKTLHNQLEFFEDDSFSDDDSNLF